MKKILLIGIGAGDLEHLTIQAVKALNRVDVFFVMDKGTAKAKLTGFQREICKRYIEGDAYRFVDATSPEWDRHSADYDATVDDLNHDERRVFERLIADEMRDGECAGVMIWGDPSLYDSTTGETAQDDAEPDRPAGRDHDRAAAGGGLSGRGGQRRRHVRRRQHLPAKRRPGHGDLMGRLSRQARRDPDPRPARGCRGRDRAGPGGGVPSFAAAAEPIERTALILVGPALMARDFRNSALYDIEYQRRFRGAS